MWGAVIFFALLAPLCLAALYGLAGRITWALEATFTKSQTWILPGTTRPFEMRCSVDPALVQ